MSKLLINPTNFVIKKKNKGLLNAGWKKVSRTKGTCWFDVESDMESRRVRECGGLVEVMCYHIQFEDLNGSTFIIGPFQTPLARHEIEKSSIEVLSGIDCRLKMLVFHVDKFEFGTQHSRFKFNWDGQGGAIQLGGDFL